MSTTIGFPRSASEITTGWLNSVLGSAGVIERNVASFAAAEIGEGQGFVGRLFRIALKYDGQVAGPASVIAKFAAADPARRALFSEFGLYEREVLFYRELQARSPVPTPRCFYAHSDRDAGQFLLLLEDLHPSAPRDPIAGATREQASAALNLISKMHGRWWQTPELDAPWLPALNTPSLWGRVQETYEAAWAEFAVENAAHLPREILRLGSRLNEHLLTVIDRLSRPPLTLVHGDYQLGNIFYGETGEIRAVADWQVIVKGRPAMDVAHLVVRSLPPEVRRRAESSLVRRYCEALTAAGGGPYSERECWEDYRLSALSQFGLGIVLAHALRAGRMPRQAERRIDSVAAVVGTRLIAALLDLRPLDVLDSRRWWTRFPGGRALSP